MTAKEAAIAILDREWVIAGHKPIHPGWALSWSVGTVKTQADHPGLFRAEITEEWQAWNDKREIAW